MSSPRQPRDPKREISASNPWYIDDQFAAQLGSAVPRAVIENRWRIFERAIDEWTALNGGVTPTRLLDAGCGDGINLAFLGRLVGGRDWPTVLVGADYSSLRVRRASDLAVSGLVQASVTALAFRDGSFDIVVCNQVLEHVPDDVNAFRELRRVLRPGGLLIVGVPNEGSMLGVLRNHVLQRSILRSTDHVNMYTRRRLVERVHAADLSVLRVEPEGFFVPHTVLHGCLNRWRAPRQALNTLARLMPSCAAGLLLVAIRPR
ncbi:MAG TPA: class I SAM-dependent methyltransferase [Vicinamibacterales bacterium]|nr:class I SAM-dependent methyltransferase [Vicinamibacterales bacterium]